MTGHLRLNETWLDVERAKGECYMKSYKVIIPVSAQIEMTVEAENRNLAVEKVIDAVTTSDWLSPDTERENIDQMYWNAEAEEVKGE